MDNFVLLHDHSGLPFLLDLDEVRGFKHHRGFTLIVYKNPYSAQYNECLDDARMDMCTETVEQIYTIMKARRGWLRA